MKAHGCGNTAPATQHGDTQLSGTERTLEQNRAAPAQEFDCKGVALSPWEKSLLSACQHRFLCLPNVDELCSSWARFRPRPGRHMTALQPSLSLSSLSSGLSGGPPTAAEDAAWGRPVSSEDGQRRQSQYWSTLPGFSASLLLLQPHPWHSAEIQSTDKAPESP